MRLSRWQSWPRILILGVLMLACSAPSAQSPAGPSSGPSPVSLASSAPAGSLQHLNVAYGSTTSSFAGLWMAQESGASAANGLDLQISLIASEAGIAALIAGDVDAIELSAAPIITADASGADFVFIGSGLNRAIFSLLVKPDIRTADDLKGARIGSDRPGTPVDFGARLLLNMLGVQVADVSLLPLGGEGALAALIAGQADAAVLAPPQTFTAQNAGFVTLKDTFDQPYQNVGIAVRRSRIPQLRPVFIRLLAAYRDGIKTYKTNPDLAIQTLQKYSPADPDIERRTYDFYRNQAPFQDDLQPTLPGTQAMIDFLASTTLPQLQGAKAEDYWDTSLLSELPNG